MFWTKNKNDTSKNPINSNEYELLSKRFTELLTNVGILDAKFKALQSDLDNLRGKFNRQLAGIGKEIITEVKTENSEEPKDINTSMYIPFG